MANKSLFASVRGRLLPPADTRNAAGGVAYALSPKQALALYAATGCLNSTYYATAEDQLAKIIELASLAEPEFVARVALYTRNRAHMKDTPALLVALLSVMSPGLMAEVFDRVIDSPKMLRTFVQIMRSGAIGRKSLGTLPKRLVQQWLENRSDEQIFRGSVGNSPSLADVIRMVHPKPATPERAALYGYLLGKPHDAEMLPEFVKTFEAFKANPKAFAPGAVPGVPMEMLTALPLTVAHWKAITARASWQLLRMNLGTFTRHGVFGDKDAVLQAAGKLRDPAEIAAARVVPYQLMAAFQNAGDKVPLEIKLALQDAMEIAIEHVPTVPGKVWVLPDVSGSMSSPVTGYRKGATSAVRCVDIAALVAAAILRKNPSAGVVPFAESVREIDLNPRDSVMTNSQKLASLPSGGTNCAVPLEHLNRMNATGDLVVYVSDNESWIGGGKSLATGVLEQWQKFKSRNPSAKLVCLDVQPGGTTQAAEAADILNIGGFADAVFGVIAEFACGSSGAEHWVGVIEKETI